MVKKAPSNDQYNLENSNMTNITSKHHNDQNTLKTPTTTKISVKHQNNPENSNVTKITCHRGVILYQNNLENSNCYTT